MPPRDWSAPRTRTSLFLLVVSLATGLATHAYHVFRYPLHLTDEGIYMEQAWSVVREGRLSPYTYFYDHAPGGWLALSGWTVLLPRQFETFGNAISTGRVLMVLIHLGSVFFLFEVVRRWSGSAAGAFAAAFLFNVSPLAVYYQRQVLLDNLMVFWVLLALYLITRRDARVLTAMAAGLAFGIALVTKENALFLLPAFAFLLHRSLSDQANRRFGTSFWWFTGAVPVTMYVLMAELKNELFPSGMHFSLKTQPADHVSLLYTVWWQLNRTPQGGVGAAFADLMRGTWLPKDRFLILLGVPAVLCNLFIGWRDRERKAGFLAAGILAVGYLFYMTRSVLLEFYIVPLVMLLALNIGLLVGLAAKAARPAVTVTMMSAALSVALLMPSGYLLKHDIQGHLKFQDLYALSLTYMQQQQVGYIRAHVSPNSRLIIDDDIWVDLHDQRPNYPRAYPHWKAASDPDVRDKIFKRDWHNIDYVVMSNRMRAAMQQNNVGGQEQWILQAIDQHGERVWRAQRGDIELAIYRINKS